MPTSRFTKTFLATCLPGALISPLLLAQHGITPSLTGSYFDDARARAQDVQQPTGNGGADPAYRFHRGYYRSLGPEGGNRELAGSAGTGASSAYPEIDLYSHSQRYGREFGRYSSGSFNRGSMFAPTYQTDPFAGGYHNFKIGPVPFRISTGASVEYNDNLTRAGEGQEKLEDVIIGAQIGLSGTYNLTRYNRITLSTGIGWDYYVDHPEANPSNDEDFSLYITDGSSISFDILLGDILVTVYERFSINRLTVDDFALDDLDLYSAFQNNAGIVANWGINSTLYATLGYDRADVIAIDDEFDRLDQGTNSLSGSLGWTPTGIWTAGVNFSTNWVDYDQQVQNDGSVYNVGAFFSSPITSNTSIRAGAGSQIFDFEEGGANGDTNSSFDDYYYNVALQNQLNARVSHSLTVGHESSLGTRSNFTTTDYVRYGVGIIGYRGSRISASVFFEDEQSSGGFQEEDYERYGVDLYWGHQLTEWFHVGLGYNYGNTESSLPDRDYEQHSFSIDTSYPLTPNAIVGAGYRFWTVDGDGATSDFDQNRIILNLNYQF